MNDNKCNVMGRHESEERGEIHGKGKNSEKMSQNF